MTERNANPAVHRPVRRPVRGNVCRVGLLLFLPMLALAAACTHVETHKMLATAYCGEPWGQLPKQGFGGQVKL